MDATEAASEQSFREQLRLELEAIAHDPFPERAFLLETIADRLASHLEPQADRG